MTETEDIKNKEQNRKVGILVSKEEKEERLNQKGAVIWLTGLSGSGKTTLANELERKLFEAGKLAIVLDGDEYRKGLNANLSYSEEDRFENVRRIAEVAKALKNSGLIVLVSLITPIDKMRELAKNIIGEKDFSLVFINAPIEVCENRDVKGLYKKARSGELKGFTGIDSPFEIPDNADLVLNTHLNNLEISTLMLYSEFYQFITNG